MLGSRLVKTELPVFLRTPEIIMQISLCTKQMLRQGQTRFLESEQKNLGQIDPNRQVLAKKCKVICPKYSKHLTYTVAHTIVCAVKC